MIFEHRYNSNTKVSNNATKSGISFAPDTFREPTFFNGKLNKNISFREAISTLHDVVVSDLRWKPKDREEYKEWAKNQEGIWLAEALAQKDALKNEIEEIKAKLNHIRTQKSVIMGEYYKKRQEYFNYLWKTDRDTWFVLDPVITVHPDELFFECFSEDESTYGKLSCSYNVFKEVNEFQCGTTNIDYSASLYNEFQKIRDYKETDFTIDPSGFEVQTEKEASYKEIKINLPDSWVRGFLQVSSAMSLSADTFELEPMDLHNILYVLKRNLEKEGPRSIRFILEPGKGVEAIFEPWNYKVECPRSIYKGEKREEIRIWGRRRLLILERLLPIADKINVTLLGSGLPSFFEVHMGDMVFTLGLSGWTANDWSRQGQFDLMASRKDVAPMTQQKVYSGLKENWFESSQSLATRLNLSHVDVLSSLNSFIQAGKVIYDLNQKVYRIRELKKEDLPMESLRFHNERERLAHQIVNQGNIKIKRKQLDTTSTLSGIVSNHTVEIEIDNDERLIRGNCTCNFHQQNKMRFGPCEHMLALRITSNKL